ncbi:hypothetical protein N8275_09300 [Pseudomonadales bacterium]|nr:hypothetical protein [Pseudomonadales bacterium]
MLKAIEWRTVIGGLLITLGPSVFGMVWIGIDVTGLISTGFLVTTVTVFAVALIFKASGVPIRATLMLLSLPVGFSVSLLLAYNGSENTEFFLGSIAAAVAGGILFLCGYQKDLVYRHDPIPASNLLIGALIITLGPLFLIVSQTETLLLIQYYHPSELLLVASILGGLFLLQKKEVAFLLKLQFVGCYGAILSAAMAIVVMIAIYDEYWVQEVDTGLSLPDYISTQVVTLLPLYFAILLYAVVVLISIAKNKTEDIMLKNWHLSEAYIFLTFLIIAPQSLYETIAGAAG